MYGKWKQEGSFTVETALVMIPVLGVIFLILFVGYFLHDRCVISGAAYETAVWTAHQERLEDTSASTEEAAKQFLGRKTICLSDIHTSGGSGGAQASAEVEGRVRIPGIAVLKRLLNKQTIPVRVKQICACPDREKIIRMTRESMRLIHE